MVAPAPATGFGYLSSQSMARRKYVKARRTLRQQAQRVTRMGWGEAQPLAAEIFKLLGGKDIERSRQTSAALAPMVIESEVLTDTAISGTTTLLPQQDVNVPGTGFLLCWWNVAIDASGAGVWDAYLSISGTSISAYPARVSAAAADYITASQFYAAPVQAGKQTVKLLGVKNSGAGTGTVKAFLTRLIVMSLRGDTADIVRKKDIAKIGPVLPDPLY